MSKQQWGHGFHTGYSEGYQRARSDVETQRIFTNNLDAHWVPAREYGSEGLLPTEPLLCGRMKENNGYGSPCKSMFGEIACEGYSGTNWDRTHVICVFPIPARSADAV